MASKMGPDITRWFRVASNMFQEFPIPFQKRVQAATGPPKEAPQDAQVFQTPKSQIMSLSFSLFRLRLPSEASIRFQDGPKEPNGGGAKGSQYGPKNTQKHSQSAPESPRGDFWGSRGSGAVRVPSVLIDILQDCLQEGLQAPQNVPQQSPRRRPGSHMNDP